MELLINIIVVIALELVLGIDNVLIVSIVADRFPEEHRGRVRKIGLSLALVGRVCFVSTVSVLSSMEEWIVMSFISVKSCTLFCGGFFLVFRGIRELEKELLYIKDASKKNDKCHSNYQYVKAIFEIICMDVIFSADSVLAAVSLNIDRFSISVAVLVTVVLMMFLSKLASLLLEKYPSMKIAALWFLIISGFFMMGDAIGQSLPKPEVYWSLLVASLIELVKTIRLINKI